MSILNTFWDRVTHAAKDATTKSPLGLAMDAAHAATNPEDARKLYLQMSGGDGHMGFMDGVRSVGSTLTQLSGLSSLDAAVSDLDGGFGVYDATHFLYDYGVNRPLGTLALTANKVYQGQTPNLDVWRQSWNQSDKTSAGQALMGNALQQADTFTGGWYSKHARYFQGANGQRAFQAATNPGSQAQRDFFKNTTLGKFSSGAADLILNVGADPLNYVGAGIAAKGVKATTFASTAERDLALDLNAGNLNKAQAKAQFGARTAKRAQRASDKMTEFDKRTQGMDMNSLMQMPEFRDTADAGALAYFYSRASAMPEEQALAFKRDLRAVAFGNQAAMERLAASRADLANELNRMTGPIEDTRALSRFSWDDDGQGMFDFTNRPENLRELEMRKDAIQDELNRLDRLQSVAGSTSKFASTRAEDTQTGLRLANVRESILTDGLGSIPTRVVKGTVGRAAPGHINAIDAQLGHDQLRVLLGRAPLPAGLKSQWLTEFAQASTRGDRVLVAQKIEAGMFRELGAKYGLKPHEVKALMSAAVKRRDMYRKALRSRLYTAVPEDNFVGLVDEDNVHHVFERPFLQSQLDDMVPMSDPKWITKALEANKRTGWIGEFANRAEGAKDVVDAFAAAGTRLWKDGALMRLAYPMRIQVDTQLRLMAALGTMDYMTGAAHGFRNMLHDRIPGLKPNEAELYEAQVGTRGKTKVKATSLRKSETYKGVEVAPARSAEEAQLKSATLEGDNTRILVMGDTNTHYLGKLRGTGQFGVVNGADETWSPSYLRAVNHQIRNSPTAMRTILEGDDAAVIKWVRSSPEGEREWANFRKVYDYDLDAWVHDVRAATDHLLPDNGLREKVLQRGLSDDDLAEAYRTVQSRPAVHGEIFNPLSTGEAGAWYQGVRERWYKFASDAPETVMGRHPYYNARFRTHMREAIDRHEGQELASHDIERIRRVADRKARQDMANTLYDMTSHRNMAHAVRYLSPFFAAWDDTMTKWARIFYDKPGSAVNFAKAWYAPERAGIVQKDDQGNEYITVPKLLAPLLPEGASNWKFRKDSANIVFQGAPWWLPGFGPAVQVPVNEAAKRSWLGLNPTMADNPVMKYLLPYGVDDGSVAGQVIPGWAKRLKDSGVLDSLFGVGGGHDRNYASTWAMLMAQEQIKYRNGQRKSMPTRKEIDRATQNWHLLRAFTSFASPVTTEPTPVMQKYIDLAHQYRDDNARTQAAYKAWETGGKQGDPPPKDWEEKFYRDFPDYFDMAVSLSVNNTGIVASDQAWNARQKYKDIINENPQYGWAVIGPANNGDFSQGVYAAQVSNGDRGQKNPADAVSDIQTSRGWMDYQKMMTGIQLELEARGLHSLQQKGAEDLANFRDQGVSILSQENPAWGRAFADRNSGKNVVDFLQYISQVAGKPEMAKRDDMQAVRGYLEARAYIKQEMTRRGTKSIDNQANADLKDLLAKYTAFLSQNSIGFEQMYQRELEADDLSGDL